MGKNYSQTLENKSSAPLNPPAGLGGGALVVVVAAETGAALVQPPKSSSVATVGAGFEVAAGEEAWAPQPPPKSFGVSVSGTFMDDDGGAAGAGSGVLHAFPPHGSMVAGSALATLAVTGDAAGFGAC